MLAKLSDIIRKDIFSRPVKFDGSFDHQSQIESVPQSLLSLVNMIINGSNIKDQSSNACMSQSVLTIAQLLVFNCFKRRRDFNKTPGTFHSKDRETPLPLYVGLKVHALTRKRQLIDALFTLGLSDSYDRIMDIVSALGNNICDYYHQTGVVCPPQLQEGFFVTAAADNLDHNPSSTTSSSSFHGTGISLFQNDVRNPDNGFIRFQRHMTIMDGARKMTELSVAYSDVKPMTLRNNKIYVPECPGDVTSGCNTIKQHMQEEYGWLEHVEQSYIDDVTGESQLSWTAYHASTMPPTAVFPSVNAMLPLFQHEASSPAIVRHSFEVIQAAVQHINPGQTPVICVDQPLIAQGKQLQWSLDSEYGEDKFVLLLGGLHTEMTSFKMLGHWLEGSGWIEALQEAKLASPGVTESFLKASHVMRTRHAHAVTACSLHILLHESYNYHKANSLDDAGITFDTWYVQRKAESPQFLYWCTCLELEILVFTFVRSLRIGDFDLYVESLTKLTPWFFSLNHTNYARWMPIHVRDMCSLDINHPQVAHEFRNGKFVMAKSQRPFSLVAIDQGHEQNNATMKGDGGIIGLTEDPDALLRWALAGPETLRVISEFESSIMGTKPAASETRHHEQTLGYQKRFKEHVADLVHVMKDLGNPFDEESSDLIRLHTRDIMDKSSADCVATIQARGQEQYMLFIQERLTSQVKAISEPIPRNKVHLFNEPSQKSTTNVKRDIIMLKNEASLFSRLYISCQNRDSDLNQFCKHENQPFPPFLSSYGQLRQGKKSDLMGCLESCTLGNSTSKPSTDVTIIDGPVLVNILKPTGCKTFGDYASSVFVPYMGQQQQHANRVDVVWDQYSDNSLKSQAREKRARGGHERRRVTASSPLPKNWHQFLRHDENKTELFSLLNDLLISSDVVKCELVVTDGPGVVCNPLKNTRNLAPCLHEEADTRIMVHVSDAFNRGYSKFMIRTVLMWLSCQLQ